MTVVAQAVLDDMVLQLGFLLHFSNVLICLSVSAHNPAVAWSDEVRLLVIIVYSSDSTGTNKHCRSNQTGC